MKMSNKKVKLSDLKVKNFDKPFKNASAQENPELYKAKIKLKFQLLKYQNVFQKKKEYRDSMLKNKDALKFFTKKQIDQWETKYQQDLKDWEKIVHLATTIQKNDPHFNYNFDFIYVN